MSALYRQARPTTFDEMVGQEHVKEVLLGALRSGRLAQAYLFSGPRGVGKTSSARLIAQAVNCSGDPRPCGACEGCRLVREGRHPDVLEIDAASNNSVEDVRELRERILLCPMLSQHKVVILDEAHMMSKSAFNALLKTLEEPPPHVIFIFATTEPERMPPTILSRTQHFRFRRLSEAEIVEKLQRILAGLGREAEPQALELVARLADGAMRDAESLLDRLLALEDPLTLKETEAILGLPPQEALFALAEALDKGLLRQALEQAQQLYTQGFAARTLAQGLLEALRAGLYGRIGLGTGPHLTQPDERLLSAMTALDEAQERLQKRSDAISLELALLGAYQALHIAPATRSAGDNPSQREAPAPPRSIPDFDPRPKKLEGRGDDPHATPRHGVDARVRVHQKEPPTVAEAPASGAAQSGDDPLSGRAMPVHQVADLASEWRRVMNALKITVRGFVREAEPRFEEDKLVLLFPERASFHHQGAQKNLEDIHKAVQEVLGIQQVELRLGGKKKLADEPTGYRPNTAQTGLLGERAPVHPKGDRPRSEENRPSQPGHQTETAPVTGAESASTSAAPGDDPHATPAPEVEPAPTGALWEEPSLLQPDHPDGGPPEPEPWSPEAPLLEQNPPDQAPGTIHFVTPPPAAGGPCTREEVGLLADPRFKTLVQLFGGRLRRFYPEAAREGILEVPSAEAEEEPDGL